MMDPSCHFETVKHRFSVTAMRLTAFGLAAGLALLASERVANAASREIDPAVVKGVVVHGLRGEFKVVIGAEPEVRVTIEGDEDALETVATEIRNDALRVRIPNASTTNVASVDGNVTVITSGGGTSHVRIGNQTFENDSEPVELALTATVPAGTIIRLEGFVGDAEIGDTGADVVLSCAGCDARLGRIAAFDVNLTGSGDVSARQVERMLIAKISGDGRIKIGDGDLEQADLAIVGSGAIDFGGHAVDATVSIVGAGDIHIQAVDNPIQSTIIGAGDVTTGG
jgi:hypothetical protein